MTTHPETSISQWDRICLALITQHNNDWVTMRQAVRELTPLLAAGGQTNFKVTYRAEILDTLSHANTPARVRDDFLRLTSLIQNGLPLPKGSLRVKAKEAPDPYLDWWGIYHFGIGKGSGRYNAYACLVADARLAVHFFYIGRHPKKRQYSETLPGLLSKMAEYGLDKRTPWGFMPIIGDPELTIGFAPKEIENWANKYRNESERRKRSEEKPLPDKDKCPHGGFEECSCDVCKGPGLCEDRHTLLLFNNAGTTMAPYPLDLAIRRSYHRLRRYKLL